VAELDVQVNGSKSIFVRVHELPLQVVQDFVRTPGGQNYFGVDTDTIEYKIGEIFGELRNKVHSGYNLREILNRVDELRFRSKAEKHEMSALYEDKIKNMGADSTPCQATIPRDAGPGFHGMPGHRSTLSRAG
jgi:hypothetical protein